MKKIRIFLALVAASALFFSSCSDLNDSSSTVSSNFDSKMKTKSLTINVKSDDDLLVFPTKSSGAERTILPAAVDASGADVSFYLAYTDTLAASPSEVFEKDPVTFTADASSTTSGTINKTFEVSVYTFRLFCVPKTANVSNAAAALSNAMFVGYAQADLRYSEAITFYLTAETATGNGNVNLSLYTSNTASTATADLWEVPVGYSVTAGIYSLVDDSLVFPTDGNPTSLIDTTPLTAATKIEKKAFGGTSAAVPSGEYNFVVKFTNTAVSPNKTYEYSDKIIILPNQKTTGNVCIPNVIESAPKAPTDFIVAYADPKQKTDTDYIAQFAWNDASNNEQSFEIQLVDVSDNVDNTQGTTSYTTSAIPTSDETWSTMLTAYAKGATDVVTYYSNVEPTDPLITGPKVKYQDSDRNPAPKSYSLIKNKKTACFYLPLGKRYMARMRAVNEVGSSDYAYLTISGLTPDADPAIKYTHTTGTTSSEIVVANSELNVTMKAFEADTLTINRYRITYNLDNGSFKGDVAAAGGYDALTDKPATVVYATQKVTTTTPVGEAILNPDGNVAKTKYIDTTGASQEAVVNLVKGENKFKRWLLTSNIDGGKAAPNANRYPTTTTGTAPDTRDVPNAYTGHTNLVLFANYAVDTTMNVNIADYTAYNWADLAGTTSDVSLVGSDGATTPTPVYFNELATDGTNKVLCRNGQYLEISATASPTITFTLNKSTKQYDEVKLVIRRTNRGTDNDADLTKVWTTPTATYTAGTGWSASPASWDVPVKTWKSGVYEATLIGTTSKYPNKSYTFTITFSLVD